jgi:hypothetical protein
MVGDRPFPIDMPLSDRTAVDFLDEQVAIRDKEIERLRASVARLQQALRVASHEPHDQAGAPIEGFPVCSICGAIQVDEAASSRTEYTPFANDYGDDEP